MSPSLDLLKHITFFRLACTTPGEASCRGDSSSTPLSYSDVSDTESVYEPHSSHPPSPVFPSYRGTRPSVQTSPRPDLTDLPEGLLSLCCFFCPVMCQCLFLSSLPHYNQQTFLVSINIRKYSSGSGRILICSMVSSLQSLNMSDTHTLFFSIQGGCQCTELGI